MHIIYTLYVVATTLLTITQSAITTPSANSNSTHQYFVASEYTIPYFQYQTVVCSAPFCHIICDEISSCYQFNIDAKTTETFTLECQNERSCQTNNIITAPSATKININCIHSTNNYTKAPCYKLQFNASQPNINPDVNIDCMGENACKYAQFYISYAADVTISSSGNHAVGFIDLYVEYIQNDLYIDCPGWYSCHTQQIYANYSQGAIDIKCTAQYSCRYLELYAAEGSSNVFVDCDGPYTSYGINECSWLQIYCPKDGHCQLYCREEKSCWASKIYVPTERYDEITMGCVSPSANTYEDSCGAIDFICLDTGLKSDYEYAGYWRCAEFDCCPYREGSPRECVPGSACRITCGSTLTRCRNRIINGTFAQNLTLICNGNTCNGAEILCPIGDDTSCIIDGPCEQADIITGNGNIMNDFVLTCSHDDCGDLDVTLNPISIDNVEINCVGNYACRLSKFTFNSQSIENLTINCGTGKWPCLGTDITIKATVNNLILKCDGEEGCSGLDIYVESNINSVVWDCLVPQSCYANNFMVLVSNVVINSFEWQCIGATSGDGQQTAITRAACESATLLAKRAIINDFTMKCNPGCLRTKVYTQIATSASVSCTAAHACDSSTIELTAANKDTNFDVSCYNLGLTGNTADGACVNGIFNLYGYVDVNGNQFTNLTAVCGQRDCYMNYFNAYNLHTVTANCPAPYSCQSARFIATSAYKLDLNCPNINSCYYSRPYCPSMEENACKITCSQNTRSCYNAQIYVADSYKFNYLDLSCALPTGVLTDGPCYGIDFNCISQGRDVVAYIYNETTQQYGCYNAGVDSCCPYFEGNTITGSDIICNDNTCGSFNLERNLVIDGSNENYLTVNCTTNSACRNAIIMCPNIGCSINCDTVRSCQETIIIYGGQLNDNGQINIKCNGYYACNGAFIEANYIDEIDINCISDGISFDDHTCSFMTFNANYANKVNINIFEEYGASQTIWNVQNAKYVILTVRGHNAFIENELKATNADDVQINLASNMNEYAISENQWYIPQNTTFNCYGFGCYNLSNIYRGEVINSFGFEINVESCGQCDSFEQCINAFTLNCDLGIDKFVESSCINNTNNCGCLNIIASNTKYSSGYGEMNCYTPYTTLLPTEETNNPTKIPSKSPVKYPTRSPVTDSPTREGETRTPSQAPLEIGQTRAPTQTPNEFSDSSDTNASSKHNKFLYAVRLSFIIVFFCLL